MHRPVISRRQLAGLLRRRPLLDATVAGPNEASPGDDDLRTIMEAAETRPVEQDGRAGERRGPGATRPDQPRGNSRM
jgi:hypothetical protein